MGREYAVMDSGGEIIMRTDGFDALRATEAARFGGGLRLMVSGGSDELSALRQALDEANAANAAKEAFLSNMSHDMRTPMNAIIGMTALAKKHIDEKSRVLDSLGKIETASGHLLSLINDVLDMSRINSGRLTVGRESFALSDLLHELMAIVRPLFEQRGHKYRLSLRGIEAEQLYGDPLRPRQIYVNIISNAVKYTPEGGNIEIAFSERIEGGKCELIFECRDDGIGMTAEFLKRIYEPFERVNSASISQIEGTGLGMSIVKRLIDAMGGHIEIESAPGAGTRVLIGIPLEIEAISVDASALVGSRWLIIEADEDLRRRYQRYLGEFKIPYAMCGTATEALEALTDAGVSGRGFTGVIIGRAQAGEGDVFEIAAYIGKAWPGLPIVLVSDHNWDDIEYRANRSGIRSFIPLPFFRKSLINGLNAAMARGDGEAGNAAGPDLSGRRILLVEDNLINREIARELLGATGAEIETAEDGRQAVDMFMAGEPGRYDVIFMDVQMPVMDGYAATRAIRASGRADAGSIPIYAMTANTFAEDVARSHAAGMNGLIAKPIDIKALMQVLRGMAK